MGLLLEWVGFVTQHWWPYEKLDVDTMLPQSHFSIRMGHISGSGEPVPAGELLLGLPCVHNVECFTGSQRVH